MPAPVPWHTRYFLVAFYAIAVLSGIRNSWFWVPSLLDVLASVLMALCLGSWAKTDARRRKQPIPFLSEVWWFAFAILLVPGYVITSRGWRGLGWVLLHSACWYLLATITMNVAGFVVFGAEWWRVIVR